jgi:TPR repeat protein
MSIIGKLRDFVPSFRAQPKQVINPLDERIRVVVPDYLSSESSKDHLKDLKARVKKGESNAKFEYGMRLLMGRDVRQDISEGKKLLQEAANENHSDALVNLGYFHMKGSRSLKFERNRDRALSELLTAAERGNALACSNLSDYYMNKDPEKSKEYRNKALNILEAKTVGELDLNSMILKAYLQEMIGQYNDAISNYEEAILNGAKGIDFHLGWLLENKANLLEDNEENNKIRSDLYAKCMLHYAAAEKEGNPGATRQIGLMLIDGRGAEKKPEEGREYLKRAAKKGDVEAMYQLGKQYALSSNKKAAKEWMRKAAQLGHDQAALEWSKP